MSRLNCGPRTLKRKNMTEIVNDFLVFSSMGRSLIYCSPVDMRSLFLVACLFVYCYFFYLFMYCYSFLLLLFIYGYLFVVISIYLTMYLWLFVFFFLTYFIVICLIVIYSNVTNLLLFIYCCFFIYCYVVFLYCYF